MRRRENRLRSGRAERDARGFGGVTRRARRGDVAEAILLLIAEQPRNGYELMRDIENRSGGAWSPSPGSVYPALERLAEERLICASELHGHRVFAITDEGLSRVAKRDSNLPAPWDAMRQDAPEEALALAQLLTQVGDAVSHLADVGTPQQKRHALTELDLVRKRLYGILGDDEERGSYGRGSG